MKQSWNDVYLKEESSKSLRRTRQTALSSQVLVLDFGCISKSREFERRFLDDFGWCKRSARCWAEQSRAETINNLIHNKKKLKNNSIGDW